MGEITVQTGSADLSATVQFLDANGNPTTPDDVPQWDSTDTAVADVSPSDDGMSATVSIGSPGAAVIEVRTTETNTGQEIVSQGTVTVQPSDVAVGDITFSGGSAPAPPAPPPPAEGGGGATPA